MKNKISTDLASEGPEKPKKKRNNAMEFWIILSTTALIWSLLFANPVQSKKVDINDVQNWRTPITEEFKSKLITYHNRLVDARFSKPQIEYIEWLLKSFEQDKVKWNISRKLKMSIGETNTTVLRDKEIKDAIIVPNNVSRNNYEEYITLLFNFSQEKKELQSAELTQKEKDWITDESQRIKFLKEKNINNIRKLEYISNIENDYPKMVQEMEYKYWVKSVDEWFNLFNKLQKNSPSNSAYVIRERFTGARRIIAIKYELTNADTEKRAKLITERSYYVSRNHVQDTKNKYYKDYSVVFKLWEKEICTVLVRWENYFNPYWMNTKESIEWIKLGYEYARTEWIKQRILDREEEFGVIKAIK